MPGLMVFTKFRALGLLAVEDSGGVLSLRVMAWCHVTLIGLGLEAVQHLAALVIHLWLVYSEMFAHNEGVRR